MKKKNYIIPKRIEPDDSDYPAAKLGRMPAAAFRELYALGDPGILHHPLIGLLCSIQCPGSIVIKTFDVIRKLRDLKIPMIGGFHSPMERECLDLLLRGEQPVILCPARSLRHLRMGKKARKAVSEGRLLVLSCFGDGVRRTTAAQSILRNDVVAALADAVLVPHASKNGKTWTAVRGALERGQNVFTIEDEANTSLIAAGARPFREDTLNEFATQRRHTALIEKMILGVKSLEEEDI